MLNMYKMNHHLQEMTLKGIRHLCRVHDVLIADKNLKIILRIMKDNPHTVISEDYHPLLLIEITKGTSQEVSDQFKPILEQYMIQEIEDEYIHMSTRNTFVKCSFLCV